jgi:hypothetical protein
MPKSSHCYHGRRRFATLSMTTVAFAAPPRKVSFEDAHSDESSSCSNSDHHEMKSVRPLQQENTMVQLSQRPSLARPNSSLSLVDLAKKYGEDPVSFRGTRSPSVSPILNPTLPNHERSSSSSSLPTMASSPWGHFVDTVISDDDPVASSHSYTSTAPSASSYRRRRQYSPVKPYGEYEKANRRSLCFLREPPQRNWKPGKLAKQSKFRRAPREEPTDQIIGAMVRLRFR